MIIKMDIPDSFEWVINHILNYNREHLTGEIVISYKDGGVCYMKKTQHVKPQKNSSLK